MKDTSPTVLSGSSRLNIRFSPDGFLVTVYDDQQRVLSSQSVSCLLYTMSESEIRQTLEQHVLHEMRVQQVRIIVESDQYCFVPQPLFNPQCAADYLNFQSKMDKRNQVHFNVLDTWEMIAVFSLPKALYNTLEVLFQDVEIEHQLTVLLAEKVKNRAELCVHIWVRDKQLDAVVLKNGNVLLANGFAYVTPEDFVYYTLNLYEQLSLDTGTCRIRLYHHEKKVDFKRLLDRYVKNVSCQ